MNNEVVDRLNKEFGNPQAVSNYAGLPEFVILNSIVNTQSGYPMRAHPASDHGVSVINYCRLTDYSKKSINDAKATGKPLPPQLKIWERLLAQKSSVRKGTAMKMIAQCKNLNELSKKHSIPGILKQFNGKPQLICTSVNPFSYNGNTVEITIDIRRWAYMAKSRIAANLGMLADAQIELGFLVEGRTDDELPEQMVGCFCLDKVDLVRDAFKI